MSKYYAILTKTFSIQNYLFSGGKLKDISNASERLDLLWSSVLQKVEAIVGKPNQIIRKAGGAFYALYNEQQQAQRFQNLWTLLLPQYLPNIHCVCVITEDEDDFAAFEKGLQKLQTQRNQLPITLPLANPLMRLTPRTGQPAIEQEKIGKDKQGEWLDAATRTKRHNTRATTQTLTSKFTNAKNIEWPKDLEEQFKPDHLHGSNVAYVHIDGNGMGSILNQIKQKRCIQTFFKFSEELQDICIKSAQNATETILIPNTRLGLEPKSKSKVNWMPARPLVLGGDDITLIIRADLALAFTQAFITKFENNSEECLKNISNFTKDPTALPTKLTACAGIAFVKINHPAREAYQLAESLCKYAKKQAKKNQQTTSPPIIPSAIAFHRLTSSLAEDYEQNILPQELTVDWTQNTKLQLTLGAYGVGHCDKQLKAKIEPLETLAKLLVSTDIPWGPLRALATALYQQPTQAQEYYQRWYDNLNKQDPTLKEEINQAFTKLLKDYPAKAKTNPFPLQTVNDKLNTSPIGDLLALCHILQQWQCIKEKTDLNAQHPQPKQEAQPA